MDICPPTGQGPVAIDDQLLAGAHRNANELALGNDLLAAGARPLGNMSLPLQEETSESQLIAR